MLIHRFRSQARRGMPLLVAASLAAVAGGVPLLAAAPAEAASGFPAHYAAPYLQVSTSDVGDMAADLSATGLKYYTLAFLTPKSGCTPEWEDGDSAVGAFNSQIAAIQNDGGNVIISFGGADGGELAQTCTSVSSLEAAYQSVVNTTGATRLDFDIEGGVLSDTASTTRRDQALAALQAADPSVQVDFTLAVNPTGLPTGSGSEYALLQDAKSQGVKVSVVNIMTMDFGNGQNALADAESAATDTASQLATLYGISTSAAYNMLGLTPIAGQNDDNEDFTTANASTLESFAAGKGVAELSFWEVDGYDKGTGYQYSSIFNAITGSSGGTSGSGDTIVGANSGLCLSVTGAATTAGATTDIYTCNSSVSENWTVKSNGTITGNNSGLCLSISGNSSTLKTTADINTCDGDGYEQWTVESNGTIVNGATGLCLSVTGSSTTPKATADVYTCNGSASENWTVG
ncbi:ricin-type beta-trefoil lectin domain protein [Actinospica durhamensis]|uniref:Ricin-type beta-trefoil lectin domain protein n=1 Tax=Actinospica durhamensis TaxID=1508375 RepID=A0A941EWZ6_9ACTN|nr:ricin-type beta-trefoil lectin domain protein [Actinospica durhamensis]MBR7837862.1 ricin-type beta-trefoil lectin domain protein [Actinospica durhamensis]